MAENHDPESAIGTITHYFGHLSVAAVALTEQLKIGDRIHVRGHTTDLVQPVDSLQIEHAAVQQAGPGDDVALKVHDHVRVGDHIFRED
jgi:hypothetical protein